jgi:putative endonuclease
MKFLVENFRTRRGEIDLIFRAREGAGWGDFFTGNESDCLVFVEVKSRSSEEWTRPAVAVDADKRRRITDTALAYLAELGNPRVPFRFDIVEVLFADGAVREVRHLPDAFPLSAPRMYR